MIRNTLFIVNKLKLNKIIKRLEHSKNQLQYEKEDIQKIIKKLEDINKNIIKINENIEGIKFMAIISCSVGIGSFIGSL